MTRVTPISFGELQLLIMAMGNADRELTVRINDTRQTRQMESYTVLVTTNAR